MALEGSSLPLAFETLSIGDEIPPLTRGPLSTVHLFRWSAAIENLHRIHYDRAFATEHDKLPDLLVNGSWKQHFVVQMLRSWLEPAGWLLRVSFQFRKMDPVNSTLTAWGQIAGLRVDDGLGYVDLDVGIRNQDGVESTPGKATGVVPLHHGRPVPYPFPQP